VQKPLIGSSSQSGLGVERYHEWRSRRKKDVFIYRRKILIINMLMISVTFVLIKFLSLFFELIVKIAFCFLKIRLYCKWLKKRFGISDFCLKSKPLQPATGLVGHNMCCKRVEKTPMDSDSAHMQWVTTSSR